MGQKRMLWPIFPITRNLAIIKKQKRKEIDRVIDKRERIREERDKRVARFYKIIYQSSKYYFGFY